MQIKLIELEDRTLIEVEVAMLDQLRRELGLDTPAHHQQGQSASSRQVA